MSAIFILEIKGGKKNKIFNFLRDRFSVMWSPMDMIFGKFPETYVRLLKSIISQFFSKYSKSYNKTTGCVRAAKLYVPNKTL